jgi:hypothetical protein
MNNLQDKNNLNYSMEIILKSLIRIKLKINII